MTDSTGKFSFSNVDLGEWILGSATDGPYAPNARRVTISEGAVAPDVVLLAVSDVFIEGVVIGPDSAPVSASLLALPEAGGCVVACETESNGEFRLGPLLPVPYFVRAKPGPGNDDQGLSSSKEVWINAGATDIVITLGRTGSIAGRVMKDGVDYRPRVELQLLRQGEPPGWSSIMFERTRKDGRFEFAGVDPGTYSLSARSEPNLIAYTPAVEIAGSSERVEVQMAIEEGARIELLYTGGEPSVVIDLRKDGGRVARQRLRPGNVSVCIVPAGEVQLERMPNATGSNSEHRAVQVMAGESLRVEFN